MRNTNVLFLALATLTAAPQARAQTGIGNRSLLDDYYLEASAAASFGRTASVDLNGDRDPDLVYIRGGNLEAMLNPGIQEAVITTSRSATDLVSTTVQGVGRVLFTDETGVHEAMWTGGGLQIQSLGLSAWADATELDAITTSSTRVFALSASGDHVLSLVRNGSSWSSGPTIAMGTAVTELVAVQWNASSPQPEVAVAVDDTLAVFAFGGTLIETHTQAGMGSPKLARISMGGSLQQQYVAWLATSEVHPFPQGLASMGPGGSVDGMFLSGDELTDLVAGRYDDDNLVDLVMVSSGTYDLELFTNQGSVAAGPAFDTDTTPIAGKPYGARATLEYPDPVAPTIDVAHISLADLDGDGDLDACVPLPADDRVWIRMETEVVDQVPFKPTLVTTYPGLNGSSLPKGVHYDPVAPTGTELRFTLQEPAYREQTANYLEVIAYKMSSPGHPLDATPMAPGPMRYLLGSQPDFLIELNVPFALSDAPDNDGEGFEEVIFVSYRAIAAPNSSAPATFRYPASILAFHAKEQSYSGPHSDYIENGIQGGGISFDVGGENPRPQNGTGIPDQERDGCGKNTTCLPFNQNEPPSGT